MPSSSTPFPEGRTPILLWAITHPTLVKAEVPLLREAGFEVVVQEPTDFIRGVEFIEYPDTTPAPKNAEDPRVRAARELGPRLRLGPRGGVVSASEAAVINWAFDSIMIATEFGTARRISQWFRGTVLFRDFGSIPGYQPTDRGLWRHRGPNLVGVPIFSGLASTRFGRSLPDVRILGTVVPPPPATPKRHDARCRVVSIFAGGLDSEAWFLGWLRSFRDSVPIDVEIRLFGAGESVALACRDLGIRPVGRLPDADYWAMFADSDLWVYPHGDPFHSHYTPLEAISLGIPCVMTVRTAVAAESRLSLTGNLDGYGIVSDRSELGALTARLLQSRDEQQEVVSRQRELLKPFSTETVSSQARELARFVTDIDASRQRPSQPPIASQDVGPPSAAQMKSALAASIASPVTVSASALAITWPIRQAPRSRAVSDPCTDTLRLTDWLVRPGPDVVVPVGAAAHALGKRLTLQVDCEVSAVSEGSEAPVMLEVFDPDSRRDVAPWARQQREGHSIRLTGYVDVGPDQVVWIRVVSALAPWGLRLGSIRVSRLDKSADGTLPDPSVPTTVVHDLAEGHSFPLWVVAISVRRARWLMRITRAHLSAVRFSLDRLRGAESRRFSCFVSSPPPSESGDNSRSAVIVLTRRPSERRLRLLVLRLGPLLIQRPLPAHRDSPLWAVGTRRGIMALVAHYTTDAT